MLLVYLCFSSGVYLYFRILMYVKRHKQFQIGCGAILNKKYIIKPHCQPRYTPSRNLCFFWTCFNQCLCFRFIYIYIFLSDCSRGLV